MKMPFKKIEHISELRNVLIQCIQTAPLEAWVPYYNFMALPIHPELLHQDRFLKDLSKKREYHGGILQVNPNTCYNWHVDTDRNSGVNMLLYDDGQSRCLFAPEGIDVVMPTVELKYAPNTFYAFNTKVMHSVLNFTTPRFLFSLEFIGKDNGLTYDQLLDDLKELGYVD